MLLSVLVAAFAVSRSCQRTYVRITQEQAIGIGQRELDFKPQGHAVRMVLRGVPPKRYWAVSYWVRNQQTGGYRKLTVALINANSGKIERLVVERR